MKYIPYVNVKMGTKSVMRYSNGNTLPLVQLPFGMVSFSLQTNGDLRWYYSPDYPYCEGVRLTHQPSPWIGDYGTFVMMPQTDVVSDTAEKAYSSFRQEDTVMRPDYLKIHFLRSGCTLELSPTERGAKVRLKYEKDTGEYLSFLPSLGNYSYRIDRENNELLGVTDGYTQGDSKNFRMYYVIRFEKGDVNFEKSCISEKDSCAHICFNKKEVTFSVAVSYINHDTANISLERECVKKTFEDVRSQAEEIWESKLSSVEIEDVETYDQEFLKTFYSCMYRVFLFPHKAYEYDENGKSVYYAPSIDKVKNGVRYTDNGFWDTYRTVYPLFIKIARKEYGEMLDGFVNDYLDSGWLPRWPSIGEVGCMPSTLIDAVIAEAVVNKIGNEEIWKKALLGMLNHANCESNDTRYGRNGIKSYLKYGYVPYEMCKESVNLTLDSAYGDYCISAVAKALGKEDIVKEYESRAKNYKNLFDKETGFMRPKSVNGEMKKDFDPFSWGGDYTEGSAWQSSFAVVHDIEGLVGLYGGKDNFKKKLDELFEASPTNYRVGGYGAEIHEMSEMAVVDFGQCAISNQPSFHIPFLYSKIGYTEITSNIVKKIISQLFKPTEDGYPGDEDNGSMSAWFVFASLGMYPVSPGKENDEYVYFPSVIKKFKFNTN